MEKNPHHLVMGELTDYLSGEILPDTHDERYRQKLARLLVETLGYDKADIEKNREVIIRVGGRRATLKIDFVISRQNSAVMMIKYAPGSLVTRRLSNIALSRILFPYQIPVVVTTNGEDAEVICGATGVVKGQGLRDIPGIEDPWVQSLPQLPEPVSPQLADKAAKISFACWIDGACPCDSDICTLQD
ncbi:MAG: type I restriction enzyme HsdR N-terminal domain-containing protein [Desulfobacter sp.]|nr:MAG: type I restriction enzyme HsdR N-terminal domain-containing protein [Desulfobacter sp.]